MGRATFEGLDPSAVAAARAAGVPEEHLQAMSLAVQQKPSALGDAPNQLDAQVRKKGISLLSDDEDEEEPEEEGWDRWPGLASRAIRWRTAWTSAPQAVDLRKEAEGWRGSMRQSSAPSRRR